MNEKTVLFSETLNEDFPMRFQAPSFKFLFETQTLLVHIFPHYMSIL